jgi:hypothetical protein
MNDRRKTKQSGCQSPSERLDAEPHRKGSLFDTIYTLYLSVDAGVQTDIRPKALFVHNRIDRMQAGRPVGRANRRTERESSCASIAEPIIQTKHIRDRLFHGTLGVGKKRAGA